MSLGTNPTAYKTIMEYLQANNFKEKQQDNIISCFEHVYEKDEVTYMDVYIHVDGATKADTFSQLRPFHIIFILTHISCSKE